MEKENILVSACLLGVNCRYDGKNGTSLEVLALLKNFNLIPVCPEQLGGMKTPREPAECIKQKTGTETRKKDKRRITEPENKGRESSRALAERKTEELVTRVVNRAGEDVTERFEKGAGEVLRLAGLYGCKRAILKERSPSCGYGRIYDGTFTGKKIPGNGITAQLLEKNGIEIIGESKAALLQKQQKKEQQE